eukprot:SAG25_NODE_724_length_5722_cov_3.506136_4_plen_150_part_00
MEAQQLMRAAIRMDPEYQLPRDWLDTINDRISRTTAAEKRLAAARALGPLAPDLMQQVITGSGKRKPTSQTENRKRTKSEAVLAPLHRKNPLQGHLPEQSHDVYNLGHQDFYTSPMFDAENLQGYHNRENFANISRQMLGSGNETYLPV